MQQLLKVCQLSGDSASGELPRHGLLYYILVDRVPTGEGARKKK